MKIYVTGLLMLGVSYTISAQAGSSKNDTIRISLKDAWQRAEENSRHIKIKTINVDIAEAEVKDAKRERLPEIEVKGSAEKASNIPIYENGIFSKPTQHEVIHTLYRAGADFYLNIYNGNKLNLKIRENQTLQKIKNIQKEQSVSDIHYKTATLYLELQKTLIFRDLIKKDIEDQKTQLKEIQALYKNG
jgi:outer membrane protein TolC